MNREGHRWTGIAVVSSFSLFLVAIGAVKVTIKIGLAIGSALVMAYCFSSFPDIIERKISDLDHRNDLIHSFPFAFTVAFAVVGVILTLQFLLYNINSMFSEFPAYPLETAVFVAIYLGFIFGGVISLHILVDIFTKGYGRTMIKPFWPFSSSAIAVGLYTSDNNQVNNAAVIIGKALLSLLLFYFGDALLFEGALLERFLSVTSRSLTPVIP